jgi:crotonobetainyl-CoA:carnitine CoA-transferase CaiB-like acyl-CoA transferase
MPEGSLTGYKVLDVGHYIAGPYCTKLMAGLGAEVIKVERPGMGDGARSMRPFYKDDPHPEKSLHFLNLNTGKKGITLNLKTEGGKKIFKDLVKDADMVVENFSPRVMPGVGLDYETLVKTNPRLIMASISNFGQTGPYRDYKALDINLMAMCGAMSAMGDPDREPLTYGGWAAQYWGGMNAFTASLIALYYREMSGEGQHIDISILECMSTLMENTDIRYQFAKTPHPRWGNNWMGIPLWGCYRCQDGWACLVGGTTAGQWYALCDLLGLPAEFRQPKYGITAPRTLDFDKIQPHAVEAVLKLTKDDIFHRGQALGAATCPSPNAEDIVNSAQLKARGFWTEINHPVVGKWTYPGAPIKMSETPFQFGPAPLLGQHNEEVYGRLGLTSNDLARLREAGVI